jgi:K+-sensing histidine kinase KdpD
MARRTISKALRPQILAYGTALVTDAIALLLTLLLQPLLAPTVFALFYPAVMISSLAGGIGPGIFATALAGIATVFFWLPPPNFLDSTALNYWVRLIALIGVALMICVLSSRYRRTKQRAEQIAQKLR